MILTAIDPGYEESAFVVLDTGRRVIVDHGKRGNFEVMLSFAQGGTVACEMIQSFGMPVGEEVFRTVFWIGRFAECARWVGCDFHTLYRNEIKNTLCRNSRANDSAIRQRVIDLFGKPGTKKLPGPTYGLTKDRWQALAVALAYLQRQDIKQGKTLCEVFAEEAKQKEQV